MKKIILIFNLIMCMQGYSQKYFHKKEIVSIDCISISYRSPILMIDVKNPKLHYQLWKNERMILNATNGMGEESFPVVRGRYKLIIFEINGNAKTKHFRI